MDHLGQQYCVEEAILALRQRGGPTHSQRIINHWFHFKKVTSGDVLPRDCDLLKDELSESQNPIAGAGIIGVCRVRNLWRWPRFNVFVRSCRGLCALTVATFTFLGAVEAQGVPCIKVEQVELKGVHLLDEAKLQQELAPQLGCLELEGLDGMLQTVTLAYVDAGYTAARAYLPEQDIGDGELTVEVVEGELAGIEMRASGSAPRTVAQMAFPGMVGRPLHIRDIEQGLDQINRLQSFKAVTELDAGAVAGETVLKVDMQSGRPFSLGVTADNRGATATGDRTFGINLGLDNPLGLADHWSISVKRTGKGRVDFGDSPPLSRSLTFSGSVPYGYWTFGLDYAWSDYVTFLPGGT